MLNVIRYPERSSWYEIFKRPAIDSELLEEKVSAILKDVKGNGDASLKKYAQKFGEEFGMVSKEEIAEAGANLPKEFKQAIQLAKSNIEKFHRSQKEKVKVIETVKGIKCWRKSVPIEKVGLYIPGGSAPLFSTILMLGIPARIAGCREIVMCTPFSSSSVGEGARGAMLYTAELCGITKIFKTGGAQAIAAMAYGTETIPKVNKIFGPGNQYVTWAKQLVQKDGIAIDMPAGPSEVAVLADKTCIPAFVASDLLSQAEHGPDSQVILVTDAESVIEQVQKEMEIQLENLPRKEIAMKALQNSKAILVKNKKDGMDLLNEYAPEHLIISTKNADKLVSKIMNAASVFIGNYSPESAGDYASGTNHTLPTNGYAKSYSGVSLDSFVKKITFQKLRKEGLKKIGKAVERMAETEGLQAHKNAVAIRIAGTWSASATGKKK